LSDPERELIVPSGSEGGLFANYVDVFDDIDYATLDFAFLDPRDLRIGFVVARVTVPTSCILVLKQRLEHVR
jgi:hypothetical protein